MTASNPKSSTEKIESKKEIAQLKEKILLLEEKLKYSENLNITGKIANYIVHEINNPLNYIQIVIDLLNEKLKIVKDTPELKNILDSEIMFFEKNLLYLKEGFFSIQNIVNDIGLLNKNKQKKLEISNIKDIISPAIRIVSSKYSYLISFQVYLSNNIFLKCLPHQICQIIVNLLVNSCQAILEKKEYTTNFHPKITIKSFTKNQEIKIEILDNGIGIKSDKLKKIFDENFTTKSNKSGNGLGLYITSSIVKDHNGSIEAESSNKGTKFTITFPKIIVQPKREQSA